MATKMYRDLRPEEAVEKGDEVYLKPGGWIPSVNWEPQHGGRQADDCMYRRPVTAQELAESIEIYSSPLMRCNAPPVVPQIRAFETGATRNLDTNKLDYEGFLSPAVLQEFARYMNDHRMQKDGVLRAADNWQKGIPIDVYMKSMHRHFMDLWMLHRDLPAVSPEDGHSITKVEALCALMFNVQGMMFELLREKTDE